VYVQLPRLCGGVREVFKCRVADVTSTYRCVISVSEPEAEEQGVPCVCTNAAYVCRSEGSL
jgi:hypothetical protein